MSHSNRLKKETHLRAMLTTIKTAPGLWIHIMGMLRAPTSLVRYVWISWGAYWIAASRAEETPRNVAHCETRRGRGIPGDEEDVVVNRMKKVVNDINSLQRYLNFDQCSDGIITYMWTTTAQDRVMERRHSSALIGVLTCIGGRVSWVSILVSTYLRWGG